MKNGPCDNCAYHRPQRSLEELLGFPLSPGINHALEMMRSVESDCVRAEIANKRLLEEQRNDVWPSQPKVVAYCGRFEDQGIFHVCEVKNKGQQCVDFKESYSVPLLYCNTCEHNVEAQGPKHRSQQMAECSRVASGLTGEGSAGSIRSAFDSIQQQEDAEKKRDMHQALIGGGATSSYPTYYDHCRKYSKSGAYVLCRVQNYHGRCAGHSRRTHESSEEAANSEATKEKPKRLWSEGGGF